MRSRRDVLFSRNYDGVTVAIILSMQEHDTEEMIATVMMLQPEDKGS